MDRPITYQWTQIGGPVVALQYATTPSVSLIAPNQDVVLTFQVAATQQRTTVTAEVQVTVESMATALNLAATASDGNESSLLVSSTSLRPGFIWPGASADLAITLASSDGAVLDIASIEETPKVLLDSGDSVYDVTNWFVFEQPQQTWRLLAANAGDFRALLIDDLMTLSFSGVDTQGRYVSLEVPLFFGRFEIYGTIQAPAGTPATDVEQTLILLEGATGKYRSTAQAAADGSFVIDGVIGDQYTVTASGPNGLFGSAFLRLEASASDTQSAEIFLVGPPSSAALQQASAAGPAMRQQTMTSTASSGGIFLQQVHSGNSAEPVTFDQSFTVGQGTPQVQLFAALTVPSSTPAITQAYTENPDAGHYCPVATSVGYEVVDTQYRYTSTTMAVGVEVHVHGRSEHRHQDGLVFAPYIFVGLARMDGDVAIAGENVPVRTAPSRTARATGSLSYDVVESAPVPNWTDREPMRIDGERYGWRRIVLPSGGTGWVSEKHARTANDRRLAFKKIGEEWKLVAIAIGD